MVVTQGEAALKYATRPGKLLVEVHCCYHCRADVYLQPTVPINKPPRETSRLASTLRTIHSLIIMICSCSALLLFKFHHDKSMIIASRAHV